MPAIHVDRKDATIDRICNAVGYTGRTVKIRTHDVGFPLEMLGENWSGGSRETYYVLNLATMQTGELPRRNPMAPMEAAHIELTDGVAVVVHSIFCGKDMGITIHINAANAAPMLPTGVELTPEERKVLECTRSYKSSYAGIRNYRQSQSGLTLEVWEATKARLIDRKLLNKAGAITIEGRNAVGSKY